MPSTAAFEDRRLIIVSNRLPVSAEKSASGFRFQPSAGGLATSLNALRQDVEMRWLGWPGLSTSDPGERREIADTLDSDFGCTPIFLPPDLFQRYYSGFSNGCLWPLFHYFPQNARFDRRDWEAYAEVNRRFADALERVARPGDRVWIHDYHLMLLPGLARERLPESPIGFFLHIPFPSSEIFRTLPWRDQLLYGPLGADLIGFHSYSYARHFLSSLLRLLGLENEFGSVALGDRQVRVETFPLGVDVEKYLHAKDDPRVQAELQALRDQAPNQKIILSVDRLDFTKGILQRLEAYEHFLETHPERRGRVLLIAVCVPSRTSVPEYRQLKREVDESVGRINGRFTQGGWTPIWYLYRNLPFDRLAALYLLADVALVTPLRDGMNLVAKEYLAARGGESGVLVLSETAGSAEELGEALIVNPHDLDSLLAALDRALEMPVEEQRMRNRAALARLRRFTTARWGREFLSQLDEAAEGRDRYRLRRLSPEDRQRLIEAFTSARHRLLLLDYDGTLVPFAPRAEWAPPDDPLRILLRGLASADRTELVIVSGRDHETLGSWLGDLGAHLVAEHGARERSPKDPGWHLAEAPPAEDWRDQIRPILEAYVDRTPGSYLEEKGLSLAWHYRRAEPELASLRTRELLENLEGTIANTPLQVLRGSKVIEVKLSNISKGRAAARRLSEGEAFDFVLAIGDDVTDEDMFAALPTGGWGIKVGHVLPSNAQFSLSNPVEVRALLTELAAADRNKR
ncbi:MAG TPA: bifunctional alpha,alpha-trehalose-phosphate synthase (UDP-forming)/trehalose-phosphatase [Anaerolineales bacterium]|nr:bifunctional alpha,alpha-trehalose-phosphate synthase (UDP-forming)/trehalose-phosphatase [Anaerolineales bacterium]